MCPQSHGAVFKHRSSVITYSLKVKYVLFFRQFKLVMLTYAERCCGFHACLQKVLKVIVDLEKKEQLVIRFEKFKSVTRVTPQLLP